MLPKVIKAERYSLTPADLARLAAGIGGGFDASIWIGAETGLRWNEIYGLQIGDLDLIARKLTVNRGLSRNSAGGSVVANEGSVKSKRREFSMSWRLCEVLEEHVAKLKNQCADAWMFTDTKGGLVRYSNWRSGIGTRLPRWRG